jgi:hypothetical protein
MSNNNLSAWELGLVTSVEDLIKAEQFDQLQPLVTRYMAEATATLSDPLGKEDLYAALVTTRVLSQIFRVTLPALKGIKSPKEYSGDGNS